MILMTIPESFKWSEQSLDELNLLSDEEKRAYLKKEEIKIRQSIGEAVPTTIFEQVAKKIKKWNQNQN
jgi:DNA (cytosine-5)-methyltransferase 1